MSKKRITWRDVTLKNVSSFLEGNYKYYKDKLIGMDDYVKEQIEYRYDKCVDTCMKQGACMYCGCDAKKVIFKSESCNDGGRFPDLMDKETWEEYKKENNI